MSPRLTDFAHTADAIAGLDLVIFIDSALAHLAGALGHPVWAILSHGGDWRYLREREDNPWYPTMRHFRQPAPGDWPALVRTLQEALARRLREQTKRDPLKKLQKKPGRFFTGPEGGRLKIAIAALLSSGRGIMEDSHDNGEIRAEIL